MKMCKIVLILIFCRHIANALFTPKAVKLHHRNTLCKSHAMFDIRMTHGDINKLNTQFFREQNKIGVKRDVTWSSTQKKFIYTANENNAKHLPSISSLSYFLRSCFIPSGDLSEYYYSYTYWRLGQRFISATNSVFGTQALLLALGFKKNQIGNYILHVLKSTNIILHRIKTINNKY